MPPMGPGPMPASSMIVKPLSGPIACPPGCSSSSLAAGQDRRARPPILPASTEPPPATAHRWTTPRGGAILVASGTALEERMRAWTVDADDIRVAEDFDESLLHRTPEIDSFLTPGPRRQVHRHRHQGLRQDAAAQGQAHPLPARRPGGLPARPATCSTSRSATRSSAGRRSPSSPRRRCRGRSSGSRRSPLAALKHVGAADGLEVEPAAHRPDRRRAAARRHRPLRPPPRLHAERAAALRHRHRRPPRAAPARASSRRSPSSSTASTSTSTSTSRASASARASPASCRRTSGTSRSSAWSRSPTSCAASTIT